MSATFWQDRPVFVTGASGLVGGWLVRRLLEAGADVVCLVRDWNPQSVLLGALRDQVTIVRGDVCDQPLLERILGEYEINTVIHLAAQTIVGIANRNPVSTFDSNIRGTWTLCEAARRSPLVQQIVLASSDKAYGDSPVLPYTEDQPLRAVQPYDMSKAAADMIGLTYARAFELPVAITRCGNFFGGGDLNFNRLVPGTIRCVLRNQRPVIRSDGQLIRDYIYVEDGAAAYMTLAEQVAANRDLAGRAFNFAREDQLSVLELTQRILTLMDREDLEPDVRNEPAAKAEIREQRLDASAARRELSWSPQYTLDEGLRRTIGWYRAYCQRHPAALSAV